MFDYWAGFPIRIIVTFAICYGVCGEYLIVREEVYVCGVVPSEAKPPLMPSKVFVGCHQLNSPKVIAASDLSTATSANAIVVATSIILMIVPILFLVLSFMLLFLLVFYFFCEFF